MQKFSDPVQRCSTVVGRVLLEWYCGVEDYCCFLGAYKTLLPAEWRRENVRIRQILAHEEYPRIPPEERKARLLDDLWPQLWALVPTLGDVLATIPLLKTLEGRERFELAAHLTGELRQFQSDFTGFLKSPHVLEVLQPALPAHSSFVSKHDNCCPRLPFIPALFQFVPAGIFQLVLYSIQTYVRATLYPTLRATFEFDNVIAELEDEDATFYVVEVCRTFAGIECQHANNPDVIFPCFSPLIVASLPCPPSLRPWLWCKLSHAENLGLRFDSVKRNLAALWEMPDILKDGFSKRPESCSHQPEWTLGDGDVDVNIKLGDDTGSMDDSLESLTQLRGLFGLIDEAGNFRMGM